MSNLPIKVKEDNIFRKILKLFFNIYKTKQNNEINSIEERKDTKKLSEKYKINDLNEINADIIKKANERMKMEEIINIIEEKPELLENLSISKLEIIDRYYKEKIVEYKKKIANQS